MKAGAVNLLMEMMKMDGDEVGYRNAMGAMLNLMNAEMRAKVTASTTHSKRRPA